MWSTIIRFLLHIKGNIDSVECMSDGRLMIICVLSWEIWSTLIVQPEVRWTIARRIALHCLHFNLGMLPLIQIYTETVCMINNMCLNMRMNVLHLRILWRLSICLARIGVWRSSIISDRDGVCGYKYVGNDHFICSTKSYLLSSRENSSSESTHFRSCIFVHNSFRCIYIQYEILSSSS